MNNDALFSRKFEPPIIKPETANLSFNRQDQISIRVIHGKNKSRKLVILAVFMIDLFFFRLNSPHNLKEKQTLSQLCFAIKLFFAPIS